MAKLQLTRSASMPLIGNNQDSGGRPELQRGFSADMSDSDDMEPEEDEEAVEILGGQVTFVKDCLFAMVRLAQPLDLGIYGHVPVRFLFILFANPECHSEGHVTEIGRAVGTMMMDPQFVAVAEMATEPIQVVLAARRFFNAAVAQAQRDAGVPVRKLKFSKLSVKDLAKLSRFTCV